VPHAKQVPSGACAKAAEQGLVDDHIRKIGSERGMASVQHELRRRDTRAIVDGSTRNGAGELALSLE